jgi:hypothetical protein
MEQQYFWIDKNDAIIADNPEQAAKILGCDEHELNSCSPAQGGAYNLSLRGSTFQNQYGGDPRTLV